MGNQILHAPDRIPEGLLTEGTENRTFSGCSNPTRPRQDLNLRPADSPYEVIEVRCSIQAELRGHRQKTRRSSINVSKTT